MTLFEFKAGIILHLAKWLGIKIRELYDSYPYNPYSESEIREFFLHAKRGSVVKKIIKGERNETHTGN